MPARKRASHLQAMTPLAANLQDSLKKYAAAASAAGVSLLAAVLPVHASVVYTPADIHLFPVGYGARYDLFYLDLNDDGINDLKFSGGGNSDGYEVHVFGVRGNRIWGRGGNPGGSVFASALASGFPIGFDPAYFQGSRAIMAANCYSISNSCPTGQFLHAADRYLGVAFKIEGQVHFGWVRISLKDLRGVISGYAYETIPDKPIVTGATSDDSVPESENLLPTMKATPAEPMLGALALGSQGLNIRRTQEKK